MYPTLSDLLRDLLGIDIPLPFPTFGFFVALSFLAAAYFFTKELKRREELNWLKSTTSKVWVGRKATTWELLSNGIIGFIIGFKLVGALLNYNDLVANPQDFIFSAKGNFFGGILGAGVFAYLKYKEQSKAQLDEPKQVDQEVKPHEMVGNMTVIAAVGGILGAKLFHNLENIAEFSADPISALTSFSGLSIYGGLIVGGGAVLYYAVKKGLTWIHVADACAPGLMAAYGIGRIGCQMAGDGDWGRPNPAPKPEWMSGLPDWMWAFDFKGNVLGRDLGGPGRPVEFIESGVRYIYEGNAWPTPFYETLMAFVIFAFLWIFRKKLSVPGVIFSLYMALNGIERFLIEGIRINPDYNIFGGVTQAELIAVIMFVLGTFGVLYFTKNKTKFIPN